MKHFFLLLFLFPVLLHSQSLSPERVAKIKACTVRILINDSIISGTGFFSGNDGRLLTCWHVIAPALKYKNWKLSIQLQTNEVIEVEIVTAFLQNANQDAVGYDFCLLVPLKKQNRPFPFLKLGNFDNCSEGQEVYTCGYPLGMPQQFISKGIISTKYIDLSNSVKSNNKTFIMPRTQALMDLTLNRGNSGGAIVKIGNSLDDDEVVGIADYIINPIGGVADSLIQKFDNASSAVFIGGIDPNETFSLFTKVLSNMSIGVSGCVSINHFISTWQKINK